MARRNQNPILILLRGPSASGKSTVAKQLKSHLSNKIAVLEFDSFRNEILDLQDGYYPAATEMYIQCSRIAVQNGFTVILDGIFRDDNKNSNVKRLVQSVGVECYMFYFDITLNETLSRHASRAKSNEIKESELSQWYYEPEPLGFNNEFKVPMDYSVSETVNYIKDKISDDT